MNARWLIAAIVLLYVVPPWVQATDVLPVQVSANIPAGTQIIPPATANTYASATLTDQLVIPRYRSGSNYPAGQIYGWGPQSVIAATANTQNQTIEAIIKTEDYGEVISEWQATSTGTEPAVLQPHLVNCTVAGYTTNNWGQGGAVDDDPAAENQEDEDLYHGFLGQANGGLVDNVTFFFIPGTAVDVSRNSSNLPDGGSFKPHDRLKWVVSRINCRRVFRGVHMNALDSYLSDVEVEAFRDYGVKIGSANTGVVQFSRIHASDGGFAGEPSGSGGAAVWIAGDKCHGSQITATKAPIGLLISQNLNAIDGVNSHTCSNANIVVNGFYNHLSKCQVTCANGAIGCKIAGIFNSLTDSSFRFDNSATATAIKITNGSNQVIRATIDATGASNAIGIDSDATLNNCVIFAHIIGGAKGIDLDDGGGGLGSNNFIWITTDGTTDAYDLPGSINASNWVIVNGTRL